MAVKTLTRVILGALVGAVASYIVFLAVLAFPHCQNQVIYLNRVSLTWFQDVSIPEQWGFLHNQVSSFSLNTQDGETLQAWHILPLGLYQKHEHRLSEEQPGQRKEITTSISFQLLHDDPEALLVLYFHGAAGTLGSGWRPPSYRAMSAAAPDNIHTVAIDYRGFGASTGTPSEQGLLTDAVTLTEWALEVAGIPASRIVLFGQSLGTAVAISLAHHLATRPDPVLFSGMVLVAPMVDVKMLTATYRIAGVVPILGPVARFPRILAWLNTFIRDKWSSKDKMVEFVHICEQLEGNHSKYYIAILHAEDDYDVPWFHSELLFWQAVNASQSHGTSPEALDGKTQLTKIPLGAAGWAMNQKTRRGAIKKHILKHGFHDKIMSYPIVSLEVLNAFRLASNGA
ncbi:uncharacterized protein JN550_008271 [Neoarthrinium moseri]|uniref:uncharacterized protein n=1 Tax=Neoarthrinium moseri TaxID=1658444 RepID=UPI001FDB298B|nr:uncharacterized protein JN550_008271 [Neoarthrinium moseri]KAI1865514.1 hypothetical protein JN550_008271 [Neoarthrinium moseri]